MKLLLYILATLIFSGCEGVIEPSETQGINSQPQQAKIEQNENIQQLSVSLQLAFQSSEYFKDVNKDALDLHLASILNSKVGEFSIQQLLGSFTNEVFKYLDSSLSLVSLSNPAKIELMEILMSLISEKSVDLDMPAEETLQGIASNSIAKIAPISLGDLELIATNIAKKINASITVNGKSSDAIVKTNRSLAQVIAGMVDPEVLEKEAVLDASVALESIKDSLVIPITAAVKEVASGSLFSEEGIKIFSSTLFLALGEENSSALISGLVDGAIAGSKQIDLKEFTKQVIHGAKLGGVKSENMNNLVKNVAVSLSDNNVIGFDTWIEEAWGELRKLDNTLDAEISSDLVETVVSVSSSSDNGSSDSADLETSTSPTQLLVVSGSIDIEAEVEDDSVGYTNNSSLALTLQLSDVDEIEMKLVLNDSTCAGTFIDYADSAHLAVDSSLQVHESELQVYGQFKKGNAESTCELYDSILFDNEGPVSGTFTVGSSTSDASKSASMSWSGFSDTAKIDHYEIYITNPDDVDSPILDWTSVGTAASYQVASGLSLQIGTSYSVKLRAFDRLQNFTEVAGSNSFSLAWTPGQMAGLSVWYDANDISSQTEDSSGGWISQWNDKSGNENHLEKMAGNTHGPEIMTYSGPNGDMRVLDFKDEQSGRSQRGMLAGATTTAHSMISVFKTEAVSNAYLFDFRSGSGGYIFTNSISGWNSECYTDGASTASECATNVHANDWQIMYFENSSAHTVSLDVAKYHGLDDYGAPAKIAEILVFDSELSDVNREQVENYLANKWGITGVELETD